MLKETFTAEDVTGYFEYLDDQNASGVFGMPAVVPLLATHGNMSDIDAADIFQMWSSTISDLPAGERAAKARALRGIRGTNKGDVNTEEEVIP